MKQESSLKDMRPYKMPAETNSNVYTGKVMTVTTDKYGNLFGFIVHKPENIYFNELDNPDMNISYEGKMVSFRLAGRDRRLGELMSKFCDW